MFGQMFSGKAISEYADYVQFDISGLKPDGIIDKFKKLNSTLPLLLHGDWEKNSSPNSFMTSERRKEYKKAVTLLQQNTNVLGLTIHPPTRSVSIKEFEIILDDFRSNLGVSVYVENRSSSKYKLSHPEEIICFLNHGFYMTLDIPQLYLAVKHYNLNFLDTLKKITKFNGVLELHLANVATINGRHYVAREIDNGLIDYGEIKKYLPKCKFNTIEVLGGIKTFERSIRFLQK